MPLFFTDYLILYISLLYNKTLGAGMFVGVLLAMAAVLVVAGAVSVRRGFKQGNGAGYRALYFMMPLIAALALVLRKSELFYPWVTACLICFAFTPVVASASAVAGYVLKGHDLPWSSADEAWFARTCLQMTGPVAAVLGLALYLQYGWLELSLTIAGALVAWWSLSKWRKGLKQANA